jgi:hypothetical protein
MVQNHNNGGIRMARALHLSDEDALDFGATEATSFESDRLHAKAL